MSGTKSLWGDLFTSDSNEVSAPNKQPILQGINLIERKPKSTKPKKPKKIVDMTPEKMLKSKSVKVEEKLKIIEENVNRILGHYKEDTLVIKNKDEFVNYINQAIKNGAVAVDTETNNSLDPLTCKLMGLCLYTPNQKNAYIPVNHIDYISGDRLSWQLTEADIKEQLERLKDTKIITHNGKFDLEVLYMTTGHKIHIYWDTLVAAFLLDENEEHKLKPQYISKIDPEQEKYDISNLFKDIEYAIVDPELFALYAATDSFMTFKLYEYQKEQFKNEPELLNLAFNTEFPIMEVTADLELTGVSADEVYAQKLSDYYHKELEEIDRKLERCMSKYEKTIAEWRETPEAKRKIRDVGGKQVESNTTKSEQLPTPINFNSSTQLAILIYDVLKTNPVDKKSPRGTGEEILEKLDYDFCKIILERRGLEKLINTYIDKLPKCKSSYDGRIHASFNSLGAKTGRYSSKDPNMQNIPSGNAEVRLLFKPKDGYIMVGADYSQQEPRIMASFSGDPAMIDAYKTGKDLYAVIGTKIFNNKYEDNLEHDKDGNLFLEGKRRRKICKKVLLAVSYGMSSKTMAKQLGISEEESAKVINNFFNSFPKVKKWMDKTREDALANGYVTDLVGRKRRLPELKLPEVEISSKKVSDFNPLLDCDNLYQNPKNAIFEKYRTKYKACTTFKDRQKLKEDAKKEDIIIKENSSIIAEALRQCVNARIQGSAATMTKNAMVVVHNDKVLKDLGFSLMIPIHDELIGECPEENAQKVADRLSELMISSAKNLCDVPMKCDAEISKRWYIEELSEEMSVYREELKEKGMDENRIYKGLKNKFSYIDDDQIKEIMNGRVLNF